MSVAQSPAWKALDAHKKAISEEGVCFEDKTRLKEFDINLNGIRLNYAFQKINGQTIDGLIKLAEQQGIAIWRDRMFSGEKINFTENRAVLHTALRRKDDGPVVVDGTDVMPEIRAQQNRTAAFIDDVRNKKWVGATGKPFKNIVCIGIGGSDMGARLAVTALQPMTNRELEFFFVANSDPYEVTNVLQKLDPATTLFIAISKTFTTQETLLNAQSAKHWLTQSLGQNAVERHFLAVSTNQEAVKQFGIREENIFPMWDWVGGRYSLWSAVGIGIALAIGNENYRQLLSGAEMMDRHFLTAPLNQNMPVIMALLGIWNRNFLRCPSLAILPYSERLRDLPRYLQQLEMESNGKSVTRTGIRVDYGTAPVLFGDCGTVGQHSFHQCLHQGSDIIPSDFIGVLHDDFDKPEHQRALNSNLAAQIGALAFGRKKATSPHDIYIGDRPSSLITLNKLDPHSLGMLLALYEHKVFVQGIIWEINSFDQPGVELGKQMARSIESSILSKPDETSFDIAEEIYKTAKDLK